jgi:hypothetical protein
MTSVEEELVKATKFKGAKFTERQDYLAALLMAIDSKLRDDDYDNLSDEAVSWHTNAVAKYEAKDEIPDFEEAEEIDPEDEEGAEENSEAEEAAEAADEELPLTDKRHPLHRPAPTQEPEDEEAADAEPVDEAVEADEEPDAVAEEEAEEPSPKPARKAAKPAKAPKAAAPDKAARAAPVKKPQKPIDYTKLTGDRDKFGVVIGTKTHEAVKMYEKGATGAQIVDALGGRHYNILTKLTEQGHRVEKLDGGVWKLTHRDAIKAKKAK